MPRFQPTETLRLITALAFAESATEMPAVPLRLFTTTPTWMLSVMEILRESAVARIPYWRCPMFWVRLTVKPLAFQATIPDSGKLRVCRSLTTTRRLGLRNLMADTPSTVPPSAAPGVQHLVSSTLQGAPGWSWWPRPP